MRSMPQVKHLYINSGIRLDLVLRQEELFRELIQHHVSGHMKLAPEHLHPTVLKYMRKSSAEEFFEVVRRFYEESAKCGKKQYVIPLFISNFPGCGEKERAEEHPQQERRQEGEPGIPARRKPEGVAETALP